MEEKKSVVGRALALVLFFTVLCGLIYPAAMTGLSQLFFKDQANGSIIEVDGVKYGSSLMAQQFTGEEYLWGRPMNLNTSTFYDEDGTPLLYSGASNKSPAGEELEALIAERTAAIKEAHAYQGDEPIPVDLVTSSGSGLDPHITVAAAKYQLQRVAENRGMKESQVQEIIDKYTTKKLFGVFGEQGVNVLEVNLALDGILK